MTIFRAPRPKNGWTELDNRLLRNKELSFKARGILSYILSHTENWATDAASIAKASEKDGRDSVQSGLKELELKWYLHRRKWQNPANGQWRTDSYVFALSNHASGTAADYNATKHPNGAHGTWSASEKAAVHGHLKDYVDSVTDRNVIRWGEDYTKTVDGMHFEIVGSPAAVARVAAKLKAGDTKVLGAIVDMSHIQYAAKGEFFRSGQVTALATARLFVRWCNRLGVASDRDMRVWETFIRQDDWSSAGAQFTGIVRKLQRRFGLVVDGVFGPKTAAVMAHDGYRIVP